jgi:glycine/sarcosine N-methyltransferase
MDQRVREFYDALAGSYHLIFEDWETSIARQAAVLAPILERECGSATPKVLDCACGIGTQLLGLAARGYRLTGSDVSPLAITRARKEAAARALDLPLYVANMLQLSDVPEGEFDAVICMDNALPHLSSQEQLLQAAVQMRRKLRPGGTLMASIRDYDRLLEERPTAQGPVFYLNDGRRRIVFQLWDWLDDRHYRFHLYITTETGDGWRTAHGVAEYRAVRREELTAVFERAGLANVRWLEPAETGFYQPILLANR